MKSAAVKSPRRWRQPSWFAVVVTVAAAVVFVRLGVWQLDRAGESERLALAFSAAASGEPVDFAKLGPPAAETYPHVCVAGRFVADRVYFRDEQIRDGRLGVEVYSAFAPSGATNATAQPLLLVDRGWIAKNREDGTRIALPASPEGEIDLRGIYAPFPGNGLRVGGNALARQSGWPKLTLAIDAQEIAADLGRPLLPRVLLLDADAASGFERKWTTSAMPPERHRAYAAQWFAFAIAAIAIFVFLHFKK